MVRLYDNLFSGNGYKIRLLLTQLGAKFERVEMDIYHGATRTPAYLAIHPNGRIPVLETAEGKRLADSNAIVILPADRDRVLAGEAMPAQWIGGRP